MHRVRFFVLGACVSGLLSSPSFGVQKTAILVMDLAAVDARPEEAATVSDLLRNELARSGQFSVVQRGEMEKLLGEQRLQTSGLTDQTRAVRLGNMVNAEKAITGTLSRIQNRMVISVQLVDIERGDIEDAATVDCAGGYEDVKSAAADIVHRVSARLPLLADVNVGSDGTIVLDAGAREGLLPGRRLQVLRRSRIQDAEGRPLLEKRTVVGEVEVVYADDHRAQAARVKGEAERGDLVAVPLPKAPGDASDPRHTPGAEEYATAERLLADRQWEKALPFLEEGCGRGSAKACLSLGQVHVTHRKDWRSAREPLDRACRAGELQACHELGRIYEKNERDWSKARELYKAACANGRGIRESCGYLGAGW